MLDGESRARELEEKQQTVSGHVEPVVMLPCPFCGSNDLIKDAYYEESAIRCQKCGMNGPTSNYADLDEKWNDRKGEKLAKAYGAAQAVVTIAQHNISKHLDCITTNKCQANKET